MPTPINTAERNKHVFFIFVFSVNVSTKLVKTFQPTKTTHHVLLNKKAL